MSVFYDNIVNAFTLTLTALIIYVPLRIAKLKRRKSPVAFKDEIVKLLFVIYAFFLAGMLLAPTVYGAAVYDGGCYLYIFLPVERSLNLVPFYTIRQQIEYSFSGSSLYPGAFLNLIANLLILIPLPPLLHGSNKKIKNSRCLLICFIAILFAEFAQYFIGRAADVDDVILNMAGALIGVFLYETATRKCSRKTA